MDNLINFLKKKLKQGASNIKENVKLIVNPQTRGAWFRGLMPQLPQPIEQGISNLKTNLALLSKPETAQTWSAGFDNDLGGTAAKYFTNRYIAPVVQIPTNVKKIVSPKTTLGERARAGVGLLGGLATPIPDPIQDVGMPVYDFLKGARAYQLENKGRKLAPFEAIQKGGIPALTMEKPIGLGEATTTNPAGQMIGNLAELPLILATTHRFTKKPSPKLLDEDVKEIGRIAYRASKNWINEAGKLDREQKKRLLSSITEAIKTNTGSPLTKDIENLKDISGFTGGFRDLYRNFKAVFGEKIGEAKRLLLDRFDKAKSIDRLNFEQDWINELKKNVLDKGIKKGSKLSELVQLYGEKEITLQELKQRAPKDWQKVVEADNWFRQAYDTLLDKVNAVRKRIYPNDPSKIIPRRRDYYRHFREIAQGYQALLNILETPAGIESKLSGISEFTKPKSKWLSFAQKRLGGKTDVDAVGGFLDYLRSASYAIHVDPFIKEFRNLANELAEKTAPGTKYAGKLNNFIEFLNDFANDLAGKTNPLDRVFQKWIPGGRKTFKAINWLNSRIKANVILGNLSSSVAQIFNVPQGIASAGISNAVLGLKRTLGSLFTKNTPMEESGFLKERYTDLYNQFDTSMLDNVKKFSAWIVGLLDEIGTKYIWNSHYEKALREGIANPVKYADDITRKLVGGRGIGEVPLAQKARIFQLVAPFQLEVGNLWWVMKDFVDEKQFGKIATLFIMNYIFNKAAEKIRGSDVAFDPINATLEGIQALEKEQDKKTGVLKLGGRLAGEVFSNIPGGQTLAAMYPEYGFNVGENKFPTRKELFGKGDPTRFGGGLLVAKGLQDPLFKVIPPFGGGQLKRTIEGLSATSKGYSETPSGRVQYPIEQTLGNYLKAGTFGKGSLAIAREYYNEDNKPLGEKQSAVLKQSDDKMGVYKKILEKREKNKQIKDIKEGKKIDSDQFDLKKENFKYSDERMKIIDDIILYKTAKGNVKELDLTLQEPKLTDNEAYNKKIISKYNSSITSKQNAIIEMAKLGLISEDEAINLWKALEEKRIKTTKSKTGSKRRTIKLTSPPKIKGIQFKLPYQLKGNYVIKIRSPKLQTKGGGLKVNFRKIKLPVLKKNV